MRPLSASRRSNARYRSDRGSGRRGTEVAGRPRRGSHTRPGQGRASGLLPSRNGPPWRRTGPPSPRPAVSRGRSRSWARGRRRPASREPIGEVVLVGGEDADREAASLVQQRAHPGSAVDRDQDQRRLHRDRHECVGRHPVNLIDDPGRDHGDSGGEHAQRPAQRHRWVVALDLELIGIGYDDRGFADPLGTAAHPGAGLGEGQIELGRSRRRFAHLRNYPAPAAGPPDRSRLIRSLRRFSPCRQPGLDWIGEIGGGSWPGRS